MDIRLDLGENGYTIHLEKGGINKAAEYFALNRKVLVVTDTGVPKQYAETVAAQCGDGIIATVPEGETSKCMEQYTALLSQMVENGFTRTDCVVAVGGGVVGDLAGFVAASYMRGVDFYNIPTTVLSQVDSSIGGKVAIDFGGYKNIVGAFHQPRGVIVDIDLLKTLPQRQISNGLAEALKMALTSDALLFDIFENGDILGNIETVIERSLIIKRDVVSQDEKENGLRKILNFGHTLAHSIETETGLKGLYHGECVALGMIPMCSAELKPRLIKILKKLNLPTSFQYDSDKIIENMKHDKKMQGDKITVVYVNTVGSYEMQTVDFNILANRMKEVLK